VSDKDARRFEESLIAWEEVDEALNVDSDAEGLYSQYCARIAESGPESKKLTEHPSIPY
jgi:hypothetical protein